MTEHEHTGVTIPTRCADGRLNWHGLQAIDLRRDALDARRRARVYGKVQGRVDRMWAGRARYAWHLFKVHLRRARELA